MQAAQCSSLASSQMWPGACRKSLESLYLGIVFLPLLSFDFVFLPQGTLQEGGAQTSGISVSLMPLGFLENYQGRYFAVVINLDAFGIVAQLPCAFEMPLKTKHDLESLSP